MRNGGGFTSMRNDNDGLERESGRDIHMMEGIQYRVDIDVDVESLQQKR